MDTAIDIIVPVLEAAVIYASYYCKACGRSTITSGDMEYGMKHAAMTTVGKKIGSHFPEVWEEESESSEEDEYIDDSEEPFTRYEGTEELYISMNESVDTWDSWEPQSPAEQAIKNAVDKQKQEYGRIHSE